MEIVFTRVDDRLIHGQVVTGWLHHSGANRIVIVDDIVADDEFMLDILEMAAPPGIAVNAYGVLESVDILLDASIEGRVLVLAKTPEVILELVNAGVAIDHLNIGGMGSSADRKKLYRNIQANEAEINAMKKLRDRGVNVEFRVVVDHKALSLNEVLSSM